MTSGLQSRALTASCESGDFAPLQQWAQQINTYDEKGGFLLNRFVETRFTSEHAPTLLRLITELKADVNLQHQKTKMTALHCAAVFGNIGAVKILVKQGANVDARDNYDSTPLIAAAEFRGNEHVIHFLLTNDIAKSNINAITNLGVTALHFAVQKDQIENARVLLEQGADLTIRDANGRRAVDAIVSQKMKQLFSTSITWPSRIAILLRSPNPLEEPLETDNAAAAKLLTMDRRFTSQHWEQGLSFAVKSAFVKNPHLIFGIFRDKTELKQTAQTLLREATDHLKMLKSELTQSTKNEEMLRQPDERTPDDFDVGRGDWADQAGAMMTWQLHQRTRDSIRLRDLQRVQQSIDRLNADVAAIEQKIEALNKLLNNYAEF